MNNCMYFWNFYIDKETFCLVWLEDGSDLVITRGRDVHRLLYQFGHKAWRVFEEDIDNMTRDIYGIDDYDDWRVEYKDDVAFKVENLYSYEAGELADVEMMFAFGGYWVLHLAGFGLIFILKSDMSFAGSIGYSGRRGRVTGFETGVVSRFMLLHKDIFDVLQKER